MAVVIYKSSDGNVQMEVNLERDSVWLTQAQIAELFGTQRPAITKHLNNIFKSNELDEIRVCSKMELTADDGKKYTTKMFNLDSILSVGYRVNSAKATQFRIWATTILKNHLVKGYSLNKSIFCLKQRKILDFSELRALIDCPEL